ncbi:cellulosome anchor protein, partial [bacterium]|nr:cellulosome anchor protein [bacterium]
MNRLCVTAATAIILISSQLFTVAAPASGAPTLILENEFIKIIVNNQKQDLGRFAVETTLGDPKNQGDNNQSLIYGRPIPWTSYTTIRVDNNDFVFGGPSNRLSKRTGRDFQFGQLLDQVSSESEIRTGYKFGEVTVTQNLSFFRTPSTRVNDSVLIEYELSNTGKTAAMVGVRLMLDTKLGSNDGAPFRMGKQSITEETKFSKDDIYPFWQAFDNLTAPSIIAQGTLDLPEDRISPPDQLILANWGSLADSPWDVEYEQGRSFIRVGEDEKDTALAIYWMPIQIAPGQTRRVRTVYGLGGLTLSPGDLSLGLTAPAEATIGAKRELVIMAYIANTGGFDSYNTVATFKMPKGIEILQGQPVNKIGQLKVGETRQIPLRIR